MGIGLGVVVTLVGLVLVVTGADLPGSLDPHLGRTLVLGGALLLALATGRQVRRQQRGQLRDQVRLAEQGRPKA